MRREIMRHPLHTTNRVVRTIKSHFDLPYASVLTVMTFAGRKVVGKGKGHFCSEEGFMDLLIMETTNGQEVLYEGDIANASDASLGSSQHGTNRTGGRAPLDDQNWVTVALNEALAQGKRVRLHFDRNTYKPEGLVVEHLQSEEGGWFCVGLKGVHSNNPGFVGHYYTPRIVGVDIL
jgi:hypothetical protein